MKTSMNGRFQYSKGAFTNRNNSREENGMYRSRSYGLHPKDDKWMYRSIVLTPGLVILIIIGGHFCISLKGIDVKTELITICTAISSGAICTLAGLLAPSPNRL